VAGDSGYLIEKLELVRWSVGQRLGLLSRKLQTAADRPGGGKVGDEGEYSPTVSLPSGRLLTCAVCWFQESLLRASGQRIM
jgi:hypothetical protein